MTQWHKGPPPSLGWWPAGVNHDLNMIRWWDGRYWSGPCWDGMTMHDMHWFVSHPVPSGQSNIEWTARPKSWPARSRT